MGVVVIGGGFWIDATGAGSGLMLLQLGLIAAVACSVYFTVAIRILRVDEVRLFYDFLRTRIGTLMLSITEKGA